MDEHIAGLLGIDLTDAKTARTVAQAERTMNVIETLVQHRKRQGLTQRDIAAAMETTQSAVSDFERLGGDPKLSTIQKYADAVGMELHVAPHVRADQVNDSWTQVAERQERVRRQDRKAS